MSNYDYDRYSEREQLGDLRRRQSMLQQALGDFTALTTYRQDKKWSVTDIKCVDLFYQVECRIKAELYDVEQRIKILDEQGI